jgi:site-specific DNA-methyltransferase (adenine-specific)
MWGDIFTELDFTYNCNRQSLAALGDSLTILNRIRAGTVDLIFADPPYNIGKNFGNNKDAWESRQGYVTWCRTWIDECFRILKPEGTLYFMSATQYMPYLDVYVSEKYHVLARIVWAYDSSGVQSKKIFGSLYEPILMVNKSPQAPYTFNYHDILIETKTGAKRKLVDYRKSPPQPYNSRKIPGNVWEYSRVRYKMKEYENHPTQKPEALLERIIRVSSNPGDVILDPFAGSFTAPAVAVRLNRRAIGIDCNEDFYKIGLRRTGITETINGESLVKDKRRKTHNKSKRDRNNYGAKT